MRRALWHIGIVLSVFSFGTLYAQNPPGITAEGNFNYCGEAPMPIVTEVALTGGTGVLDVVYIQIVTGYTIGEDLLLLDGVHPNIQANWSVVEGQLVLTGPASFNDFENAIRDVRYTTTESNFTSDKQIAINLDEASYLPETGHYYRYVSDPGITWLEAKDAAEEQFFFGMQGYLVTITTAEEAQLTGAQSPGTGWIGGSDQQTEGVWRWETGPEAGMVFWNGLVDGASPDGVFSFWNNGEPNNLGNEDYAHITDPDIGILGSWNDLEVTGSLEPNNPYHPQGYIVEFGGMAGDSEIVVSATTTIITPKVEISSNSICDEGFAEITLDANTEELIWYASANGDDILTTGASYQEFINETTTFYVMPLMEGCTQSNRIPITVVVYDSPTANNISIVQCDDAIEDGITSFNLNTYTDDIIRTPDGFVNPSLSVEFFEDLNLSIPINGGNYQNISNNQIIYAYVYNNFTMCHTIAEVQLQVNVSSLVNSPTLTVCDDFIEDGFVFFDLSLADDQILTDVPINATLDYFRTYEDALLRQNVISSPYFNETQSLQTIFARVDTDEGCYAITEVYLVVEELPNLNQFEEVYYCLNTFPETITLTGGIIDDIPNNYAYDWSTGETTMNIDVNETGSYTVFVTRPAGCTNRRIIQVLPSGTAIPETIEVDDFSNNNTITVLVSGEGEYVYALDDPNDIYQESNTFENIEPGIYTVYIRDIKADCGVTSVEVSILGYPKFFTPNGDTQNDVWQIKGFSARFPNTAKVSIFDRYGKLITVLNEAKPFWDGSYNGQKLPTNDYWFVAELNDGRVFKGHFTLKR